MPALNLANCWKHLITVVILISVLFVLGLSAGICLLIDSYIKN
jgi:hypothetical protein